MVITPQPLYIMPPIALGMTELKVGDKVRTTTRYTGTPTEGTIKELNDYKYLGLVATVLTSSNHAKEICVVVLERTY
jgi:hypothetical protein